MDLRGKQKQCKACPWKKSVVASRDVPNYSRSKHEKLVRSTQTLGVFGSVRAMSCHETQEGKEHERPCVGWLYHELGPGNNIALRLKVRGQKFTLDLNIEDQHDTFEDSLEETI